MLGPASWPWIPFVGQTSGHSAHLPSFCGWPARQIKPHLFKICPKAKPPTGSSFQGILAKTDRMDVMRWQALHQMVSDLPVSTGLQPSGGDCRRSEVVNNERNDPSPPLNSTPTSSPHLSLSFLTWDFHATQRSQKLTERENAWPKCPSWRL